jgi:RimK family alpha-L-glutamate ligase
VRPSASTLGVIAGRATATNTGIVAAARRLGLRATIMTADEASMSLLPGDVALARLDVVPALDGVEPGLWALRRLEEHGVRVLNSAGSLLMAHDKLMTALRLGAEGIPHPRTAHVDEGMDLPRFETPVVVKPRFGSWGEDVYLCRNRRALRRCLRRLHRQTWFRRQGALVQELIEADGQDLRIIVAGDEAVGAVERVAAKREWRTNVSLGGRRRPFDPPPEARELAVRAAQAIGADLVGVDLLPDGNGGHVVLELNGAADFTEDYSLDGEDVFLNAVAAVLDAEPSQSWPSADQAPTAAMASISTTISR